MCLSRIKDQSAKNLGVFSISVQSFLVGVKYNLTRLIKDASYFKKLPVFEKCVDIGIFFSFGLTTKVDSVRTFCSLGIHVSRMYRLLPARPVNGLQFLLLFQLASSEVHYNLLYKLNFIYCF